MAVQSESAHRRPTTGAPAGPVLVMRHPPLWRRLLAWLLLLLFCLTAPFALLAGWGRWALSDADRFVTTVRSAADDPRLQAALAEAVRDRLDDGVAAVGAPAAGADPFAVAAFQANPPDPTATAIPPERAVRRASSTTTPTPNPAAAATPAAAPSPSPTATQAQAAATPAPPEKRPATPELVASPIAGVPGDVVGGVEGYFRSPAFAEAWDETSRQAYATLREDGPAQPLALDFSPILPGLAAALDAPVPAGSATALRVELLDAEAVERLRTALDRLDWLSILLPIAALLLLIGTLWAGPGKLRWLRRLGFGLALSMIVLLLTLLLGGPVLSGRVANPLGAEVVRALLDALLWWPVLLAAALVAFGLALAAVTGLADWFVAGRRARA